MLVQVNTDRNIEGSAALAERVEAALREALGRFTGRITRVEVHLSDHNAVKGGANDKRCLLEARLAGLKPIAVSHEAATIEQAVDGATRQLERSLDSTLGRLRDR